VREIQLTQSSHPEKEENKPYHIFMVIINSIGRHLKERHGGFLEKTACPPSSESPLKYLSASLFFNCQNKKILESCNAQNFDNEVNAVVGAHIMRHIKNGKQLLDTPF